MSDFIRLGPGQVGRLAFQVIGANGPIPNPKKIKYIPVDSLSQAVQLLNSVSPAALNVAASGLIFAAQVGAISLQMKTLSELKKINGKLDSISVDIAHVAGVSDKILSKVEAIEASVAINNFRHSLNYVLENSMSDETLDLEIISELFDEVASLVKTVSGDGYVDYFSPKMLALKLPIDVRGSVSRLVSLMQSLRLLMVERYNNSVGIGDYISTHSVFDYLPPGDDFLIVGYRFLLHKIADVVSSDIYNSFFWAGEPERQKYSSMIFDIGLDGLHEIHDAKFSIASDANENRSMFYYSMMPYFYDLFRDSDNSYWHDDFMSNIKILRDMPDWWLLNTDAGLLFRFQMEVLAIKQGYSSVFSSCSLLSDDTDGEGKEGVVFDFDESYCVSLSEDVVVNEVSSSQS